jgi:hypothetical protein
MMADDLRVVVANRPGSTLAAMDALAGADINVDGFCGDIRPGESWGSVHFLVQDGKRACDVLEAAGVEVTSWHKVEVIEIEDTPGALAKAVRSYAESGRNIEILYSTSDRHVVVATEDMREDLVGVQVGAARYS